MIYNIEKNMLSTSPKISTKSLENLPTWSPDGNYLYYISGPDYHEKTIDTIVKYDLLRISYDAENNVWGTKYGRGTWINVYRDFCKEKNIISTLTISDGLKSRE